MYLLVEFTDNTELAVIPDNWLDGNICAVWPPFKTSTRVTKAVLQKEPRTESWKSYPIRVLYKHESYDKVRSKLKRAEMDSDLQTDTCPNESQNGRPLRRKRSPNRYSSSDSEESLQDPQHHRRTPKAAKVATPPCTSTCSTLTLPTPPPRIYTASSSSASQPLVSPPLASPRTPSQSQSLQDPRHHRSTPKAAKVATPPCTPVACMSTCSTLTLPTRIPRISTASSSSASQPLVSPPLASPRTPSQSRASRLTSPSLTSQSSSVSSIVARDVRLFTILEKIRDEQQHQTSLLTTIVSKLGAEADAADEMPEDISFPIENEEQLKSFEERIKDKYTEKLVVGHIASIGGSSLENMANRILKHMMSNTLAGRYNWTGSKDKMPFRSLGIPLLVKRAVRRSFRLVTMSDIEACSKSFLKSAKDRDGGRQKRMKKTNDTSATSATASPTASAYNSAFNESSSEDSAF